MKNSTLAILILSTLFYFSCEGETTADQVQEPTTAAEMEFDESKEKDAIMDVIYGETDCFYARDYACWKSHWVNDVYTFQAWTNSDGTYNANVGWNAIDAAIGNYIKEHPIKEGEVERLDVQRKDLQVKFFNQEVAYLIWEQYNQTRDGKSYLVSQETRLMEKVAGDWKIVNVTALWSYENMISVDSLEL